MVTRGKRAASEAMAPTECMDDSGVAAVRCCADTIVQPAPPPTSLPSAPPSAPPPDCDAVQCPGGTACLEPSRCDPNTGTCAARLARPPGIACDDGNPATRNDVCVGDGTCRGTGGSAGCRTLGWPFSRAGATVCATSFPEACRENMTHAAAEAVCRDAGGRLCTLAELEADLTAGSGCMLDMEQVWSSSACELDDIQGRTVTRGKRAASEDDAPTECLSPAALSHVRCCADLGAGDDAEPQPPDTRKSCEQLGWGFAGGQRRVCAASEVDADGGCPPLVTHTTAVALCAGAGGRLCSLQEIEADLTAGTRCHYLLTSRSHHSLWGLTEPAGTGCMADLEQVHTATACALPGQDPGYYVHRGRSSVPADAVPTACSVSGTLAAVRCCAGE